MPSNTPHRDADPDKDSAVRPSLNDAQDLRGCTRYDDVLVVATQDTPDECTVTVHDDLGNSDAFRVEGVMLNSVAVTLERDREMPVHDASVIFDQPGDGPGDFAWIYVNETPEECESA